VLRIQKLAGRGGSNGKSMPASGASAMAVHQAKLLLAGVRATSTVKT